MKVAANLLDVSSYRGANIIHTKCWMHSWLNNVQDVISITSCLRRKDTRLSTHVHSQKCSDPIRFRCQKVLLQPYFRNWISTAVASGQYQITNAHICIRPVWIACLRAVFVELIQSCRTDTDPIYSLVSDPLRFWVQIWIRLVPVLIQMYDFAVNILRSGEPGNEATFRRL